MWIRNIVYWLLLFFCLKAGAAWVNLRGVPLFAEGEDQLLAKQQYVTQLAAQQLGRPYRLGGQHPYQGFDCSGLVNYVYKSSLDKTLPRTSAGLSQVGLAVKRQQLQAGDLVFFNTTGKPYSHVGIYLGDQRFIHAPRNGKHVTIAKLSQRYWSKRYQGAKRLLTP